MIVEEIQDLLGEYRRWLQDKTILHKVNNDWVEITALPQLLANEVDLSKIRRLENI